MGRHKGTQNADYQVKVGKAELLPGYPNQGNVFTTVTTICNGATIRVSDSLDAALTLHLRTTTPSTTPP